MDRHGDPVFFQLQHPLDLDTEAGTLTEEQQAVLLQDPRYKDPATGKLKTFPYKILLSVVRTMTEADGREWLKARWTWEGLNRAKQIETSPIIDVGVYDHPEPETRLVQADPKDKDSPSKSIITAMHYQQVYDIPLQEKTLIRK